MHRTVALTLLAVLLLLARGTEGGGSCPTRAALRPCACFRVGRATAVTCSGLTSLADLLPALHSLDLDLLHIRDSFWGREEEVVLPSDLPAREVTVVDSKLAACPFACPTAGGCAASLLNKLTIVNSTSKLCGCTASGSRPPKGTLQSWTGCAASSLAELRMNEGALASLSVDLFSSPMEVLRVLDLSRNRIAKVEPLALRALKELRELDLSHNLITHMDHALAAPGGAPLMPQLEKLDLSFNLIASVGAPFFQSLPGLKRLLITHNALRTLAKEQWGRRPLKLRNIDLSGNAFHCDCGMSWVNGSFAFELLGECASPPEYASSRLRRAATALAGRCSQAGVLGPRPRKNKRRQ